MEQQLRDILINTSENSVEELNKLINEKPLYDLLVIATKRNGSDSVSINRKYAKLYTNNSVGYCINPRYFENNNKLRRAVYSIIKSAFKDYKRSEKENIEILLNCNYQADRVTGIKNKLEESYGFNGTDAGVYEVPLLGEAVEFSRKKLSVKAINGSALKEYI